MTLFTHTTKCQEVFLTQYSKYTRIYQSLYVVYMVCSNESPTKVKTYAFIRIVSFSGHSQYLAAWANMTP